jgi:protein TonB
VKRLLPAAVLAIGIHGVLMSMDFDWLSSAGIKKPSTDSVTITLESVQPRTPKTKVDPLPPHRYPQEIKKLVVEKIPESQRPAAPDAEKKPVETIKKPEKKKPLPKPLPVKPRQPAKPPQPKKPVRAPQKSTAPSREIETTLPAPRKKATAVGGKTASVVPDNTALPSVVEDALPEYSENPPVAYPRRARRRGYEGMVLLEVLVNKKGKVDDLRILSSSGYDILDRSAVKSVKTWSFKPARKGKETIEMWVKVPVRFQLK